MTRAERAGILFLTAGWLGLDGSEPLWIRWLGIGPPSTLKTLHGRFSQRVSFALLRGSGVGSGILAFAKLNVGSRVSFL